MSFCLKLRSNLGSPQKKKYSKCITFKLEWGTRDTLKMVALKLIPLIPKQSSFNRSSQWMFRTITIFQITRYFMTMLNCIWVWIFKIEHSLLSLLWDAKKNTCTKGSSVLHRSWLINFTNKLEISSTLKCISILSIPIILNSPLSKRLIAWSLKKNIVQLRPCIWDWRNMILIKGHFFPLKKLNIPILIAMSNRRFPLKDIVLDSGCLRQ